MSEEQPPTSEPSPHEPRPVNLAAVAGGVILIALVAFAIYQRHAAGPAEGDPPAAPPAQARAVDDPMSGTAIGVPLPARLSPEAAVLVERYRCICGCKDPLAVCTCDQTPGSNDMKAYVQELVDAKKSPAEIDAAMVERYGRDALLDPATGHAAAVKR